jgi:hypothetical protein
MAARCLSATVPVKHAARMARIRRISGDLRSLVTLRDAFHTPSPWLAIPRFAVEQL